MYKKILIARTMATTTPGYRNANGQMVVRATGFASGSFPGQRIYHLRCGGCSFEYGANGCDIHNRRCPKHQDGEPGESLRDAGPTLFDLGDA